MTPMNFMPPSPKFMAANFVMLSLLMATLSLALFAANSPANLNILTFYPSILSFLSAFTIGPPTNTNVTSFIYILSLMPTSSFLYYYPPLTYHIHYHYPLTYPLTYHLTYPSNYTLTTTTTTTTTSTCNLSNYGEPTVPPYAPSLSQVENGYKMDYGSNMTNHQSI
jgi:hypothetical protein